MIRKIFLSTLLLAVIRLSGAEIGTFSGLEIPSDAEAGNVKLLSEGQANVFEFNGQDAYITTSVKLQPGKSFAFSTWVKPDFTKVRQSGMIVQPGYHNYLGCNGAKEAVFSVYLEDKTPCSVSGPVLDSQSWYMLSGVYSAEKNNITLYINGKVSAEASCPKALLPNNAKVNLGASRPKGSNPQYFAGKLAFVHIYNHAPDAAEISALYEKESGAFPTRPAPALLSPKPANEFVHTGNTDTFTADCLNSFPEAEFRKDVETLVSKIKSETGARKKLIEELYTQKSPRLPAVKKRAEILDSLLSYFDRKLLDGSRESLLFAWCAQGELRMLGKYFGDEEELLNMTKNLPEAQLYSVKDFGAKADGKTDDGPAIRQAIAAAIASGKASRVFLPAGTYRIIPDKLPLSLRWFNRLRNQFVERASLPEQNAHIIICSPEHLTLEGEKGTVLLMSDPGIGGIRLLGAYNTTLKNFSIDYEKLPFTQGRIVSVNPEKTLATIEIDPGYPQPDLDYMLNAPMRRITMISPETRCFIPGSNIWPLGKVSPLGNRKYEVEVGEFYAGSKKEALKPGNLFDIKARRGHSTASAIDDGFSKFTTIDGVIVNSSPSVAFYLMSTAVTLRNSGAEPPTGTDRLISSNADGIQVSWGTTAIGPYIENCRFVSIEDDGINLHSGGGVIEDITDEGRRCSPEWLLEADSELYIIDGMNGQIKAVAKSIRKDDKLEFYPTLPNSIVTRKILKQKELSLRENLEQRVTYQVEKVEKPDVAIIARSQFGASVLINSTWKNVRGLGVQLSSPSVWIENCNFEDLTGSGVAVTSLMSWGLYYSSHNSAIRNSRIRNAGGEGIIVKCIPPYSKGKIPARSINSIFIENNEIKSCASSSIRLDNCYEVEVTGNRISASSTPNEPPSGNFGAVTWKNNTLNPDK